MAVFKCKMCGGALEINNHETVAICEYCGTNQTIPTFDDEKKLSLFNRANNLRFKSEFDKAAGIYENIIAEFPDESEAYWGLVLCKYGIEYVDDKDGKKIPTCHRTLPTPIMRDEDFQQACENADIIAKGIYREEAKAIDVIQKKILEIVATEEPYDIFICYKETDEITGSRTEDSSIAQDIYTALTETGYKVFYARNSLRRVAGTEYEPYIYAALSSAKIMVAIGTKYDYYDAVWVKNEWSRFISMMSNDSSKVLIPCFKNMDAYDIPEEFSNMQALDMTDMMFFNSLEASVKRALPIDKKESVQEVNIVSNGASATIDTLLKRVGIFLEDGEWNNANEYCEKVLDINPECAEAYLGKLMVDLKLKKKSAFDICTVDFENNKNYKKIIAFGDEDIKKSLAERLIKIKFDIEDSVLIKYNGLSANAIIPEGVKRIGEKAFSNCGVITSIVFPGSLIEIGCNSFENCTNLKSICISDIGAWCKISFEGFSANPLYYGANLYINEDLVTDVIIPDNETSIGDFLFVGYARLNSVKINDGVTSIGNCAFQHCKNLSSVSIPDSVTSIGGFAFNGCKKLSIITIPYQMNNVAEDAFSDCESLESINVDLGNTCYCSQAGVLFNTDKTILVQYPAGKLDTEYMIPDGVTVIDKSAFRGCKKLTTITIPNSVESIGDKAFYGCESLISVTISEGLMKESESAFDDAYFFKNNYEKEQKRKERLVQMAQYRSKGLCQHCGGVFKGFLTKKCSRCGIEKNY